MKQWEIQSHSIAIGDLAGLFVEQYLGNIREDVTVVLDQEGALDLIAKLDQSLYKNTALNVTGSYFYLTSGADGSYLICENAINEEGNAIWHETDILILPYYIPEQIVETCTKGCKQVIKLAYKSSFDNLIELINS